MVRARVAKYGEIKMNLLQRYGPNTFANIGGKKEFILDENRVLAKFSPQKFDM